MNSVYEHKKLGEICDFFRGLTYKKKDEAARSNNVVLRANNISLDSGILNFDEIRYIDETIKIPESKYIKKGSLLICTASGSKKHLGKVALIDKDYGYAFGGFMGMLTPHKEVDPKYLYWVTRSKSYFDFIQKLSDGANINNLKFSQLAEFDMPIPPLTEQKRIVAILDETFAGIESAITNTEKNLANTRELFESYLNTEFSHAITRWEEFPLENHIRFIDYRGKTPKKTLNGLRLITAKNVRMGYLQREPEEFVAPEEYDTWMTRGIPKKGDVLFTTEAPLGFACQLDTEERVVFAQRIITMQPDRGVIHPDYLKFALRSSPIQSRIHEKATGATATGIKASLLKKIRIPIPEITEQIIIAENAESLEQESKRLEIIYQQKLTALAELKQSLLQKAFSGDLTAKEKKEVEEAVA